MLIANHWRRHCGLLPLSTARSALTCQTTPSASPLSAVSLQSLPVVASVKGAHGVDSSSCAPPPQISGAPCSVQRQGPYRQYWKRHCSQVRVHIISPGHRRAHDTSMCRAAGSALDLPKPSASSKSRRCHRQGSPQGMRKHPAHSKRVSHAGSRSAFAARQQRTANVISSIGRSVWLGGCSSESRASRICVLYYYYDYLYYYYYYY